MICDNNLLFIEPSACTSSIPLVDSLTRKMTAAFRQGAILYYCKGFHVCACGVFSSNSDYSLPNGDMTNSLCIHYLAFHRDEVPEAQLSRVAALNCGEAEPTIDELSPPRR